MNVAVSDGIISREVGGQLVLIDVGSGVYFSLEGAGGSMWRELAEHGSLDKAVAALEREFDADPRQIRIDLERLVEQLRAKRLLKIVRGGGSHRRR